MIDVQDPTLNSILNAAFFAIVALAVVALVPWRTIGLPRVSDALRWLAIPVLVLAVVYEWDMPSRFDIRVDLVLLVPVYAAVIATSLMRWRTWRHDRRVA